MDECLGELIVHVFRHRASIKNKEALCGEHNNYSFIH